MSEFTVSLVLLIIETIVLTITLIATIKADKSKKLLPICAFIIDFIAIIVTYLNMSIPIPEVYPSNGQISKDGIVSIHAPRGLGIYYTLDAYSDPNDSGIKYEKDIILNESSTINVKTHFLTKWSECVTLDLVINEDGEINANQISEPGTSIKSINAYLLNSDLYSGLTLINEDIKVEGTTINGDIVPIDDFIFTPNSKLQEGKNVITIEYNNMQTQLEVDVRKPKLINLEGKFIWNDIKVGDIYSNYQFEIIGKYEDGSENEVFDFDIFPKVAEKSGECSVKITKDEIETNVKVTVSPTDPVPLFVNCYVEHEPKGVAPQIGFNKWDDEKVDIQGINHEGHLYLFIGDLFNMMQPTGDSKITATIHFIVNPKYKISDKLAISGNFVVDGETMGSNAYTMVSIKSDGKEKWVTKKKISGDTIKPVPFSFDIENGNTEMTMTFKCNALDSGLGIGIIFDDIN